MNPYHTGRLDAEQLLRQLGVTGKLKGFSYAIHMIEQTRQDPTATSLITKRLYPRTAERFGTTSLAVERDLRTLVNRCWTRSDRTFLSAVAGTRLEVQPTNSEFLDMTAAYLRRQP